MSRKSPSRSLSCEQCGLAFSLDERFCSRCGMPLVFAGHERIDPEYTRGELVRVAGGRNQAEAELIQNLLREEGIPSIVRRSAGFDVPDYLARGPRDVLVPESAARAAHDMLLDAELAPAPAAEPERARSPLLAVAVVLAVLGAAVLVVYLAWVALPPAR